MRYRESFQAGKDDEGRRLDRVIRKMFPHLALSWIYGSLRRGGIRLNGRKSPPATAIREGDTITIAGTFPLPPPGGAVRESERRGRKEELRSLVLFQNEHCCAFNKPRGLPVHGVDSLACLAASFLSADREGSLAFRPGPVHRLDRGTTGIIIFSRSLFGAKTLSALLRGGRLKKVYLALLSGALVETQVWKDRLARLPGLGRTRMDKAASGRYAETIVKPLIRRGELTLALCQPVTGRRHQIRVQAGLHGHPLVGDRLYGGSSLAPHYILHAACVSIQGDDAGLGFNRLTAPLPQDSRLLIDALLGKGAARRASHLATQVCGEEA